MAQAPGWTSVPVPAQRADNLKVFSTRFSPENEYIAAAHSNGHIAVLDSATGAIAFNLNTHGTMPTTQVVWRPLLATSKTKNVLVSVNSEDKGLVQHWHIKSGKCLHTIEDTQQIFAIDYTSDGQLFATAGQSRAVKVYDEATKRVFATLVGGDQKTCAGHSNRVFSVKFHPLNRNTIVTGGWDNTVQVWDARKGHAVMSMFGPYVCGDGVDISPDGLEVATASWRFEDNLQIWDMRTGTVRETPQWGAQSNLYTARYSKDGSKLLAGGSGEHDVVVLQRTGDSFKLAQKFSDQRAIFTADVSTDMTKLCFAGASGYIRCVDL
mmetsp:Transcript_35958/g.94070  ORF Transcript_35958/g.94070 Transcript_35958/m.94070 type:complete len:323 (+) Transcript_35958:36-1004(+)